jgi:hypothetical protein
MNLCRQGLPASMFGRDHETMVTTLPPISECYSDDYATARSRFLDAGRFAGAGLSELEIAARGPEGAGLFIDIAWLGSRDPVRAFVHSSGLHGVEGFAGSAIQVALLRSGLSVPEDAACIFVHALNPFGMAWLRRSNEHNVDLNRNFLFSGQEWSGVPEGYRMLASFLNPSGPPGLDFYYPRALWQVLRHGLRPLSQAIAQGQYEFPSGLFYGGAHLEQGPELYSSWLCANLGSVASVLAVDVHTGLGRWCQESLFLDGEPGGRGPLTERLGRQGGRDLGSDRVGYEIHGGYTGVFDRLPVYPRIRVMTQEFGTYSNLRLLHALREENRRWHHGERGVENPESRRLKDVFAPRSARWRGRILARGVSLAKAAMKDAFAQPGR